MSGARAFPACYSALTMPRQALPFESGPYRSVKLDARVDAEVVEFAKETTGGNVAEALRLLIGQALERGGRLSGFSDSLEERGYNAGFTNGLSEARTAIAEVLNKRWKW
mgnify:CR=1 FL=1